MCISMHVYVCAYAFTPWICTHTHIATYVRMSSRVLPIRNTRCHNKLHSLSLSHSILPPSTCGTHSHDSHSQYTSSLVPLLPHRNTSLIDTTRRDSVVAHFNRSFSLSLSLSLHSTPVRQILGYYTAHHLYHHTRTLPNSLGLQFGRTSITRAHKSINK